MTPQHLRQLADRTGLDGIAEALREAADEIDALQACAQVQGEPVAWMHWLNGPVRVFMNKDEAMMALDRLNREYPVDSGDRKMRPLILGDTTPQPAQATQADVTDEQIESCALDAGFSVESTGSIWAVDGYVGTRVDPGLRKFARAILALRPAAVPMTYEQRHLAFLASRAGHGHTAFMLGISASESHHGIKPKEQE